MNHPTRPQDHMTKPALQRATCCTEKKSSTNAQNSHQHHNSDDHVHAHSPAQDQEQPIISNGKKEGFRFSWQISGMDCASCARKVENAVRKLPDVQQAQVLFTTEKLIVDASSDISAMVPQIVSQAGYSLQALTGGKQRSKESTRFLQRYGLLLLLVILIAASSLITLFNPVAGQAAFIVTTLIGLYPIVSKSIFLIRSGTPFAIETLMSIAAIGAIFIGATAEAAMVLLLFMIGELLESYAANRARSGITALMELVPEKAVLLFQGERRTVSVEDLRPGDIIEIAPGARLPADAELLEEFASFDASSLTGESIPVEHQKGERVAASCLVVDRVCRMKVTSQPGNNAIDRILTLIEEAEERRAPIERFLDRFSRYYTPTIMLLALASVLIPPLFFSQPWEVWIYRGLTLLLIGCPCALVISTPAAITSGLAAATRNGALIKGGAALEQLGVISQIAFDKTGTLTKGKPSVTDLLTAEAVSEQQLLLWSAAIERGSHHPLAVAICQKAEDNQLQIIEAQDRKALPGMGIQGKVDNILIKLLAPKHAAHLLNTDWQERITQLEQMGKTVVIVIREEQVAGIIALKDTLRPEAIAAIAQLRLLGISGMMLTGDNPRAAAAIAQQLGIEFRAGLLPDEKVTAVMAMRQQAPVAMVGDGINDAPAMKSAHIGIAMGGGTDVALETADAALTQNNLTGLSTMIQIARETRANIRQNVTIAIGLKAIFLVTSILGITGLWLAVLADSGATALVTANALRLLRKRKPITVPQTQVIKQSQLPIVAEHRH